MAKFIFVTGGVLSSLGKGLTAAAIGTLLESMHYKIAFLKLDPYLNVDPGTMNPCQHGEVFVTDDGAETDLDLGHYERFTQVKLQSHSSTTAGKLYAQLITKERHGDFLGSTIQIVPHLTDAIKQAIQCAAGDADCTIVEIGGTVGDIEGLPFIEAIRQMGLRERCSHEHRSNDVRADCIYIHLTYVPYLETAAELKTKPTQHAVKELLSLGIQPDILICRSQKPLSPEIKQKIALFTNVDQAAIISAPDLALVYELPLYLAHEQLAQTIVTHWKLPYQDPDLTVWQKIVATLHALEHEVTIAIVGKYINVKDAYKSLTEALIHAQIPTKTRVEIVWINAEELTPKNLADTFKNIDGIIIPGGFGDRGIEGKILAAGYARTHDIPFLGICLGMQVAAIEFARSVLNLSDAHSTEFNPQTPNPVIDLMKEQKNKRDKGGTMRLGAQICCLKPKSRAEKIYQKEKISERHRHRYELNTQYKKQFEQAGLKISGMHESQDLPEIIELSQHPFFIGCQFHPELQSKPYEPHPLFVALVQAALIHHQSK